MLAMSASWLWPNWASAIAAIASPTPTPRPPWPARCGATDSSRPWSSASARRRTRSSTVSSGWPPRGHSASRAVSTRLLEADERQAKAAIYGLNQTGRRTQEWEEAWIVHALVREDGMTQVEVAELLGRHKSWVCRRLALVEKLADDAREDLRLGLLSATAARSLVRLPAGNQVDVLATLHRDELTAAELDGVVGSVSPRAAGRRRSTSWPAAPGLAASAAEDGWAWDPDSAGRQSRRAAPYRVLDGLGRMETWLRSQGRAGLTPCDRLVLTPAFSRLARDAQSVATLAEDLIGELHTHDRADAQ